MNRKKLRAAGLMAFVLLSLNFQLALAHRKLDEAVFAACGRRSDLTDEEILERLLSLNLERAQSEAF